MSGQTVTTYTQARATLADLLEQAESTREPVIIRRRKGKDVALIAMDELSGLLETAHLLRSPANARRLLQALVRAQEAQPAPATLSELKRELGVEET